MTRMAGQLAELALATMNPKLVDPGAAGPMVAAASRLSAAPGLGFECRLGASGGPIDVSQRFRHRDSGPHYLRALASARAAQSPQWRDAWSRLAAFADHWEAAPERIAEVWLEADAEFEGGRPLPSIFVLFRGDDPEDAHALQALSLLAGDLEAPWRAVRAAVGLAQRLSLEPGRLFGLMLSRSGALRATFRRPGAIGGRALLVELGWSGPLDIAEAILGSDVVAERDHQLVLDFAPELQATAGFEILFDSKVDGRRELEAVLAWLAARRWAQPDRVDALLDWPGTLSPGEQAGTWPDGLVARGMLRDPRDSVLLRFVNHLKVNLAADAEPLAKAYFALCAADVA